MGSGVIGYSYTYKIWTTPSCGQGTDQIPTQTGYNKVSFIPIPGNNQVGQLRLRPPRQCGQIVSDCIADFYTNQGWLSVGLFLGTIVAPEIGVGIVAGCMLGCGLNIYPLEAC